MQGLHHTCSEGGRKEGVRKGREHVGTCRELLAGVI